MSDLRPVFLVIGAMIMVLGLFMLLPIAIDLSAGNSVWSAFAVSAGVSISFGAMLVAANRTSSSDLSIKGAFVLTVFSWLALSVFAALPLIIAIPTLSFTDALFEAVSGITTTGSTVMSGLDELPKGLLLWRAILQWIGGIGIIVTAMAVLPMLKVGGMQLFRIESSDVSDKILPRATHIAGTITIIYLALTLLCAVAYWSVGMSGFDGIAHAMTTISTGGYSTSDNSLGGFLDLGADMVGMVFMIAGGLPFALYMLAVRGKFRPAFRDEQSRAFLLVIAFCVSVIGIYLWQYSPEGPVSAFRLAAFNVVSIITGTGYATADYGLWGPFAVAAFFIFMFIGGCAGSTACSIKIFRYQVAWIALKAHLLKMISPHRVAPIRYGGRALKESAIYSVLGFFFLFFACFAVSAIALSALGLDPVTAWSGAASSVANVGPGLGHIIGPEGTYEPLPDAAKWILMTGMLIGRLEVITVLVIFTPGFWRA